MFFYIFNYILMLFTKANLGWYGKLLKSSFNSQLWLVSDWWPKFSHNFCFLQCIIILIRFKLVVTLHQSSSEQATTICLQSLWSSAKEATVSSFRSLFVLAGFLCPQQFLLYVFVGCIILSYVSLAGLFLPRVGIQRAYFLHGSSCGFLRIWQRKRCLRCLTVVMRRWVPVIWYIVSVYW